MQLEPHVHGLVPILATPFFRDGEVDYASLRRVTEFQLESGVDGVAVSGMASETFALTALERQQILTEVVKVADGTVPVVAGVNATSTVTAVEQGLAARDGGADLLMVLPPFMVKPTTEQLIDFYATISEKVDLPLMVQDAPGATGITMPPDLLEQISAISNVCAIKVEAPPTAPKVAAVSTRLASAGIAVLGGQNAQFCLEEYARGAVGTMPACEFSDVLSGILRDWESGAQSQARKAFSELLPLLVFGLQQGFAWAVHKYVLAKRGLITDDTVRSPARPLHSADRASLDAILEALPLT